MNYGGGINVGQVLGGLEKGQEIVKNEQNIALTQEAAMRARKEYEDYNKPIPVEDFMKAIPDLERPTMMKLAQSYGLFEDVGGAKVVLKGKGKEFINEIGKNSILQTTIAYESGNTLKKNTLDPLKQKITGLKSEHDAQMRDFQIQRQEIIDKAKAAKRPQPSFGAMKKIDEAEREYMESDTPKQLKQLTEEYGAAMDDWQRRIAFVKGKDQSYETLKSNLKSRELALLVMTGQMTEQEAMQRADIAQRAGEIEQEKIRQSGTLAKEQAKQANKGRGGSTSVKEVDKKIKSINEYIKQNYDAKIKGYEKRLKAEDLTDKDRETLQWNIDDALEKKDIAIDTINKLRGGDITPSEVKWGNKEGSKTGKTLDEATAARYIKMAKGNLKEARKLAIADGYNFK